MKGDNTTSLWATFFILILLASIYFSYELGIEVGKRHERQRLRNVFEISGIYPTLQLAINASADFSISTDAEGGKAIGNHSLVVTSFRYTGEIFSAEILSYVITVEYWNGTEIDYYPAWTVVRLDARYVGAVGYFPGLPDLPIELVPIEVPEGV